MSTTSKIEWTEATWNPVTGCDRISPGCDNCYALTLAKRLKAMGSPKYQADGRPRTSGPGFGVTVHAAAMTEPLSWRKPRTVFVNSMSDLAHARVPRAAQARIWAVMALAGRHQFQVLTKRPQRVARVLTDPAFVREVSEQATDIIGRTPAHLRRWRLDLGGQRLAGDSGYGDGWTTTSTGDGTLWTPPWPLPNVWLGTSIETDDYTWRADKLRKVPAAVRFLSLEPLLGPLPSLDLSEIDWVIVGGESGSTARPMHPDWAREVRNRCQAAAVPFFFKQRGQWTWEIPDDWPEPDAYVSVVDGRTADEETALVAGGTWTGVWRVGKGRAGRHLDGRIWNESPAMMTSPKT